MEKQKMSQSKRLTSLLPVALVITAGVGGQTWASTTQNVNTDPVPRWAFPGPMNKSIPESSLAFSDVQMFDRTSSVDWFPGEHPPMPPAVKGRLPVYACGFCHLPQGAGRPENMALAGLPYVYLKQQIDDMQTGARNSPDSTFGPGVNMILTIRHNQLSKTDAYAAAKYFSQLTYLKHTKVVETEEIPHITTNSFVYVFDKSGARERLGERIIEGPDDFIRFEMRDPNVTFTAYVPEGSSARGAALARGNGGAKVSCDSCHGPGLKGGAIGPPIAGRPLTPIFRQLYAFKIGTRNGPGAAQMKPIVANLSQKDMIDLAVYVGSLEP